jgi:Co/Zn/Cd efflux system component
METANTLGEMITVASIGLVMMAMGALILIKNSQEG